MGALKDLYRIGIPIARANHVLDLFAHLIPLSEKVNNIIKNHVHHFMYTIIQLFMRIMRNGNTPVPRSSVSERR